jgi:hypothetical protein
MSWTPQVCELNDLYSFVSCHVLLFLSNSTFLNRQPGIDGHPGGMVPPDVNHGFALRNEPIGSENPVMTSANVEIVIPQAYLGHVYGENCSNLNYIKQVCCR